MIIQFSFHDGDKEHDTPDQSVFMMDIDIIIFIPACNP